MAQESFKQKGSRVIHHWQQRLPSVSPLKVTSPVGLPVPDGWKKDSGMQARVRSKGGAVGLWEYRDRTMWYFNTPHMSLSVQQYTKRGCFTLSATHIHTLTISRCYSNTHYPLCILQLGGVPQDLASLPHALRSPRHVHPNVQPTVVERALQLDDFIDFGSASSLAVEWCVFWLDICTKKKNPNAALPCPLVICRCLWVVLESIINLCFIYF